MINNRKLFMMLYLINALYFKSKWQMKKKFDKEKTKLD